MGSHSHTMVIPSQSFLDQSSTSDNHYKLETKKTDVLYDGDETLCISVVLYSHASAAQHTIQCLREWGICHCNTVSHDLALLIIGHHKQQVARFGDGNIIIATLVNTFW